MQCFVLFYSTIQYSIQYYTVLQSCIQYSNTVDNTWHITLGIEKKTSGFELANVCESFGAL